METALLIKSAMGLVALLIVLFTMLFFSLTSRKKKEKKKEKKEKKIQENLSGTNLQYLKSIIKNKDSSTKELDKALKMILKHHGTITQGEKKNLKDFDTYMEVIFRLCRHQNVTKELIINFSLELEKLNTDYKNEINNILLKGLKARTT